MRGIYQIVADVQRLGRNVWADQAGGRVFADGPLPPALETEVDARREDFLAVFAEWYAPTEAPAFGMVAAVADAIIADARRGTKRTVRPRKARA